MVQCQIWHGKGYCRSVNEAMTYLVDIDGSCVQIQYTYNQFVWRPGNKNNLSEHLDNIYMGYIYFCAMYED